MLRSMVLVSALSASVLPACATDGSQVEVADEYVFGLTVDEVLAAKRVAQQPMTDDEWLDLHRGSFRCDRYGDLCAMIGYDATARIIEMGYRMALSGADEPAVTAAQSAAIDEARIVWRSTQPAVYDSDTETSPGTGADNLRLSATAWANWVFPGVKREARGECSVQVHVGLWFPYKVEQICGTMTGTFNSTLSLSTHHCDNDTNSESFGGGDNFTRTAGRLTTRMVCSAQDGLWSASRTSDVTID